MSRLGSEKDGPALWFRRITDYPREMTAFVNPMATWRRVALTFGLSPDASLKEIYAEYEKREKGKLIPPRAVKNGACKDIIKLGKDVDLL